MARDNAHLPTWQTKRCLLKGQTGELWKALCGQAAEEQDPEKLLQLVKEINRLLEEKEARLKAAQKPAGLHKKPS